MKLIVISLLLSAFVIALVALKPKKESTNEKGDFANSSPITAAQFVSVIDSLGYFKYAAEEDIEPLKESHLESFDSEGAWGGLWDDETGLPLDYRYYYCDGEYVYEEGGFTGTLTELERTFQKIGLEFIIEEHFEEWDADQQWLNHRIKINGTEYVIFKNHTGGYAWGEAVKRLAEILNAELEKQALEERVYLINGGNDGHLIFLDQPLYKFFYQTFSDPQWKPLEVKEWAKEMGLD